MDFTPLKRRLYHNAYARRAFYLPSDLVQYARRRRTGSLTPPKGLVAVGPGDHDAIGREFLDYFVRLTDLKPGDRVLDVGCGVGRIAAQLAGYLSPRGSYEGFDIVSGGIEWCQKNITPRFPNFRFQVADIYNRTYHPDGTQRAEEYAFPYQDESFDFVFMTSVVTHLLPDAVERYLDEAARVLKPGRACLITWFLLTDESRRLMREGRASMEFPFDRGEHRIMNESMPEMNVAYDEMFVRRAYERAGLRIREPIHWGGWSGRMEYLSSQDVAIAVKTEASVP